VKAKITKTGTEMAYARETVQVGEGKDAREFLVGEEVEMSQEDFDAIKEMKRVNISEVKDSETSSTSRPQVTGVTGTSTPTGSSGGNQ
jgi:hypothetical protein